ncbi:MAG: hypothetical protein AAGA23_11095 [Pseudomonadota bacterium]
MRIWTATLLTLTFGAASATIEGTFWDRSFDGEGWAIESQNDIAFFTWYTYESDGSPTFRTATCELTYSAVSLDSVVTSCSGTLSLTRDRTNTTALGPFSAEFRWVEGRLRGIVDANGDTRNLEPFNFNFADDADFLHGIWSVAEIGTEETDADTVIFDEAPSVLEDGTTPARTFTTLDSDGAPGFAYFDSDENAFVGVQELPDGTRGVVRFQPTDDKALGVVFDTDAAGNMLSDPDVVLLASVLNTEGERASQAALLGLISGKRSRPLTMPLRRVPRHTFAQLRERLRQLQRESSAKLD